MLKRAFEIDLEHCPNCGGELKNIAAILEQPVIKKPSRTWVCRPAHRRWLQRVGRPWKRPECHQDHAVSVPA